MYHRSAKNVYLSRFALKSQHALVHCGYRVLGALKSKFLVAGVVGKNCVIEAHIGRYASVFVEASENENGICQSAGFFQMWITVAVL